MGFWLLRLPLRHSNQTVPLVGSSLWSAIRCSGFGAAAVSNDGDLVSYGLGWPPSWCDTAAPAEAWAMLTVLAQCPFVPPIRTDCQALLTTAMAVGKIKTFRFFGQ